jgi:hypothetical protein
LRKIQRAVSRLAAAEEGGERRHNRGSRRQSAIANDQQAANELTVPVEGDIGCAAGPCGSNGYRRSAEWGELSAALAKAQAEFMSAAGAGTNPHFKIALCNTPLG